VRPIKRNVVFSVVTVLCSVIIAIAFLEGLLWVFHLPPYPEYPNRGFSPDENIGFVLKPNNSFVHSQWEFYTNVTVNEGGYRGDFFEGRDSSRLSLVVGDSFAFGQGLNDDETISSHLARMNPDKFFVNLGVSSYSTIQENMLLERYLDSSKIKPDSAILLFYVGNDFYDNRRFSEFFEKTGRPVQTASEGILVEDGTSIIRDGKTLHWYRGGTAFTTTQMPMFYPPEKYKNKIFDQLKLYNFVVSLFADPDKTCRTGIAIPGLFDSAITFSDTVEWKATKKAIDQFVEILIHKNIQPLLVIVPSKYQMDSSLLERAGCDISNLNLDSSIDAMVSYARKRQLPYIDLREEFGKAGWTVGDLYYRVDSHLTPIGSAVTAEILSSHFALKKH
jgi:hypothetical protein